MKGDERALERLARRLREAGLVETHFHVGPEFIRRRYDVTELANAVRSWNATVVLKNHTYSTTPLASHARHREGVRMLGGIVLNRFVGGINPDAVWSAASGNRTRVDAEQDEPTFVVWMPTVHARSHLATLGTAFDPRWGGCTACAQMTASNAGRSEAPVEVFDSRGQPTEMLWRVLQAIAAAGARLATGHLSADEILRLVPLALEAGVPAVILTHPHYPSVELSDVQLKGLSRDSRVFIEHCFAIHTIEEVPLDRFAESIKVTGPEQVILSTDFGQVHSPPLPDASAQFVVALMNSKPIGVSEDEFVAMCSSIPRRALGLAR